MFKVLFLQRLYGMSDPQIEYHIKDRTSFRDFLDIQSVDDVPDEKTVWKYKDARAQSGTYDALFKRFNEYLDSIGLIVNEGKNIRNVELGDIDMREPTSPQKTKVQKIYFSRLFSVVSKKIRIFAARK